MKARRATAEALSPEGKEQFRAQLPLRERTGVKNSSPPNSARCRGLALPNRFFRACTVAPGPRAKKTIINSSLCGGKSRGKPRENGMAKSMPASPDNKTAGSMRFRSRTAIRNSSSPRVKPPAQNCRLTSRSISGLIVKTIIIAKATSRACREGLPEALANA
ncbi:hypothetical protein D3C72_1291330 [compost metagenome]